MNLFIVGAEMIDSSSCCSIERHVWSRPWTPADLIPSLTVRCPPCVLPISRSLLTTAISFPLYMCVCVCVLINSTMHISTVISHSTANCVWVSHSNHTNYVIKGRQVGQLISISRQTRQTDRHWLYAVRSLTRVSHITWCACLLTSETVCLLVLTSQSEWVSTFLTAHQHILGYLVPYNGKNVIKM